MANKQDNTEGKIIAVEEALGKTEQFIEKNQKNIIIVVAVLAAIVMGYFGFKQFYLKPQENKAHAEMFYAEKYFELDSLDLALNGTSHIPEGAKAIIQVTDGEDDDSGLHVLIEKAKKHKTKIYTIGIGDPEGARIPIKDQQGYTDFLKDENGNIVITKLDENTLQYIADETGGEYINLSENKDSIFKILQIAHSLDKAKDEASREVQREEKYQIFLFIAFILFCFAVYLPVFKEGKND